MIERAVTNTACVIALERIERLDFLPRVIAQVFAPPAVRSELRTAVPWLTVQAPTNIPLLTLLTTQLGAGEAGAIALALELGDARVILDDKKARGLARGVGLTVIGTLGVLLLAKRQGMLPRIEPLLAALREAQFHMSPALYREVLRLADEAPQR